MKKVLLSMLVASVTLMASDAASVYKTGVLLPPDGPVIYKKQCAVCHGENGKRIAFKGSIEIAGMDADKLAKELKDYRYGSINKYGYGAQMKSALVDLSWDEIDAVAKYVNGLK
ncbi:MAG: c-type cytochrome [Thiovulaceae bacterium]|nr:c-type cytochrome [Sulfurimonadaceae bacterium]